MRKNILILIFLLLILVLLPTQAALGFSELLIEENYTTGNDGQLSIIQLKTISNEDELSNYIIDAYSNPSYITGEEIADLAKEYEGYDYSYGGCSTSGFDCSGFVWYVYDEIGLTFPLRTRASVLVNDEDSNKVTKIEELQEGDIVFFGYSRVTHWGIYLGENEVIHAYNYKYGVTTTDIEDVRPPFLYGCRFEDLMQDREITFTIK